MKNEGPPGSTLPQGPRRSRIQDQDAGWVLRNFFTSKKGPQKSYGATCILSQMMLKSHNVESQNCLAHCFC